MKSWAKWNSVSALALVSFFLTTVPLFAAETGEVNPADSSAGLIFRWLNFAIVFGGIGYLIAKHGGVFFRANAVAIASSITEAQAAKAAADRELNEVSAKLSRIDQDIAELREAAHRDAAAEGERLRASGQAEIEKIRQAARGELAASERAAQQQLRELAASVAVDRAGALVSSRMNGETQAKLFYWFLAGLTRSAN